MWTKGELIAHAFGEIGLSDDAFNVAPEDRARALRSLDSMMATWNARGFRLGYALLSSAGESDVGQDSGLPDTAHEAVYLNLSLRLAPSFGKMVSQDMKQSAKAAYDAMILPFAFPPAQAARSLPVGAGNRHVRPGAFFPDPADTLDAGDDAALNL